MNKFGGKKKKKLSWILSLGKEVVRKLLKEKQELVKNLN